jgi:hypothetical protein
MSYTPVARTAVDFDLAPTTPSRTVDFEFAPSGGSPQSLSPVRLDNTNSFFNATVVRGTVTLQPGLLSNSQAFFAATVTRGTVTLQAGLLSNSQTFFTPTVTRGTVSLQPGLLSNSQTFYSAQLVLTNSIQPAPFTNTNNVFVPTATRQLSANLFISGNDFYSHELFIIEPRFARPVDDLQAGAWTSTEASLFAAINEIIEDDETYISTSTPSTCAVKLGAVSDPQTSTNQTVYYRAMSPDGGTLIVRLKQSNTVIATVTNTQLTPQWQQYSIILSPEQCDAITDYADLNIELEMQ